MTCNALKNRVQTVNDDAQTGMYVPLQLFLFLFFLFLFFLPAYVNFYIYLFIVIVVGDLFCGTADCQKTNDAVMCCSMQLFEKKVQAIKKRAITISSQWRKSTNVNPKCFKIRLQGKLLTNNRQMCTCYRKKCILACLSLSSERKFANVQHALERSSICIQFLCVFIFEISLQYNDYTAKK